MSTISFEKRLFHTEKLNFNASISSYEFAYVANISDHSYSECILF